MGLGKRFGLRGTIKAGDARVREMFAPEKCPKCGKRTVVEVYDTGWRVICSCGYYGIFHFDKLAISRKRTLLLRR